MPNKPRSRRLQPPAEPRRVDAQVLIVLGCSLLGIHSLRNEKAADEFFFRAVAWSLAGNDDFLELTEGDVKAHIGLSTMYPSLARPAFMRRVTDRIAANATSAVSLKKSNAPIHLLLP